MFTLTHTYFLQKFLAATDFKNIEPDIYVYNIIPDLLTIHPQISPDKTHNIKRSLQIPVQYSRSAYVMFHLLVDDLSHYGYICFDGHKKFDPNSQGYSYLKGKHLINSILDLYGMIEKNISYEEAIYQSHLIIEMIFDLVILNQINSLKTIDLLIDSINFTLSNKMDEFVATINWLYKFGEDEIKEVMKKASLSITKEGMEGIMSISGRINLYREKFGLKNSDQLFYERVRNLFQYARDLIDDDELFLLETAHTIKNYGWIPTFR
ncbi:MAG: hypothetical protein APR62_01565 [Smithella sp. SDB]|nr:MAG: hypothetical protein APR62_01565 [Smithella sp. SDB]